MAQHSVSNYLYKKLNNKQMHQIEHKTHQIFIKMPNHCNQCYISILIAYRMHKSPGSFLFALDLALCVQQAVLEGNNEMCSV